MTPIQFYLLAAAPFVGSFLSVLAIRLPAGENWTISRSRCRSCAAPLRLTDLVPLASYALSRGRCRHCGAPIGTLYPTLELTAAVIALWGVLSVPASVAVPTVLLGWALLELSVIDARHYLLPDLLTLPLIAAGLGVTALLLPQPMLTHVFAAAVGGLLMWGVAWVYRRARHRDGLGFGDAKLFAAAGAWVGPAGLPSVLLIASVSGILAALMVSMVTKRPLALQMRIPFGPFLSLGLWLTWLYGPVMIG